MSLTNGQVHDRFNAGRAGHNGRNSLASVRADTINRRDHWRAAADGATLLYSYDTCIAIRRDSDGQLFKDGHTYSITTSSQHGGGHGPLSFRSLTQLMGPDWWREAEIVQHLPVYGNHSDGCDDAYYAEWEKLRARPEGERGSDPERLCTAACVQDRLAPDGLADGWSHWTLLRFPNHDALCGGCRGQRHPYAGDNSQLWAAILPERANTVAEALAMLRPLQAGPDAKRQGDLYFEPLAECPPPGIERINTVICAGRDGVTVAPRHTAAYLRQTGDREFVRGDITHPQHKRLRLGKVWHRVLLGRAVKTFSADVSQPMGSGRGGAD